MWVNVLIFTECSTFAVAPRVNPQDNVRLQDGRFLVLDAQSTYRFDLRWEARTRIAIPRVRLEVQEKLRHHRLEVLWLHCGTSLCLCHTGSAVQRLCRLDVTKSDHSSARRVPETKRRKNSDETSNTFL